jgi:hypothetical protein
MLSSIFGEPKLENETSIHGCSVQLGILEEQVQTVGNILEEQIKHDTCIRH